MLLCKNTNNPGTGFANQNKYMVMTTVCQHCWDVGNNLQSIIASWSLWCGVITVPYDLHDVLLIEE